MNTAITNMLIIGFEAWLASVALLALIWSLTAIYKAGKE
jgi:hypothetical protein